MKIVKNRTNPFLVALLMVAQLVLATPQPALAQTTAPATSLVSYPVTLGISRQDASTVAFSSSVTAFECSLDDAAFADCTSPVSYKVLPGTHTFKVHAIAGGVAGPDASHTWTVGPYEPWSREVIMKGSGLPLTTAIALHTDGSAHIVYATYSQIVYARWDPGTTSWATQVVDTIEGDVCNEISLALDTQGRPHAAYCQYAGTQRGLYYATSDGTSWTTTLVDPAVGSAFNGQYNSLALDASGYPHISYYQQSVGLRYAAYDGLNWNKETVDATCTAGSPAQCAGYRGTSLALDASGKPRISYYEWVDKDLEYAAWNGSAWVYQTVDSFGDVGAYSSLKLDAYGNPHVGYLSMADAFSARDVRYAAWNGTGWDRQVIGPAALSETALALDSLGRAHISYKNASGNPEYAAFNGQAWRTEQVTSRESAAAKGTSWLALDAQGRAHLSVANLSWETYVYEKALAGSLRATLVLSGSSYSKDAQFQVCLSGGTIGDTADCKMATGNGGTVEWQGLMPGSDYTVSAPGVTDWTGQADQSGLAVVSGARTKVNAVLAYRGTALPDTRITGRPMFDRITTSPSASFEFESSQTDSTFESSLDGASFADCPTPYTSASLAPGAHTLNVRAKNSRGAVDPSPAEFRWNIDPTSPWQLAELGTSGDYPSVDVALDGAGLPRVVSGQQGTGWYTAWNGGVWASSQMPQGFEQSLAIDASGRTHIAYKGRTGGLYYGVWNGNGWDTELVSGSGGRPDLALDASGKPHIAFADGSIKYATRDEGDWQHKAWKIEAATSEQDSYPSLALDASGNPSIAFLDNYQTVKYTSRTSAGWSNESVGAVTGVMDSFQVSLALAGDGQPRVAYCDAGANTASTLHYAARSGGTWTSQAAASWTHRLGCLYPSLALDGEGHPHIASYEWGGMASGVPHYTVWTGTAWDTKAIETLNPQSATDMSLVLDQLGRPNIVYADLGGGANGAYGPIVYALGEAGVATSAPGLATLSPASAAAGSGAVNITVAGSNFVAASTVRWNGVDLATTFAGATQLVAVIPANELVAVKTAAVTVFTPEPGGGTSETLLFFVTEAAASVTSQDVCMGSNPKAAVGPDGNSTTTAQADGAGLVGVAEYAGNPGGTALFKAAGRYFDVYAQPDAGGSFASVTIVACGLKGGDRLYWWDASTSAWLRASPQTYDSNKDCVTVVVDGSSSPTVAQLGGTYFAAGSLAEQTITFGPLPGRTYGDASFDVSATGGGSGNPVTFSASGACTVSGSTVTIGGAGNCTITASQAGDANFNAAQDVAQTFTIAKKAASVSAVAAGKTYGEDDPAFSGALSGFLAADGVTATHSRTAGEAAGGSYTISAVLAPTAVLGNYDIAYYTAAFTISQRPIQAAADAKSKYAGEADPPLTYQITGGALVGTDSFSGALSRAPGETAGTYSILQGTLVLSNNYNLTYVGANLTIQQLIKNTATALNLSSSPALLGQPVTFSASVAPVAPATGLPAGAVTFYEGTTALGTVTLVNGQAHFTTSTLALGSHSIKAIYSGNAEWQGSESSVVSVMVNYQTTGFTTPVDLGNLLNTAKAGQMIPLKWRLLDGSGNPVTNLDPASVTLTVSPYTCPSGAPTDAIETYATGTSNLQNLGNGYYQMNWKTLSSYANSCKKLTLNIGNWVGDGFIALFQFKK